MMTSTGNVGLVTLVVSSFILQAHYFRHPPDVFRQQQMVDNQQVQVERQPLPSRRKDNEKEFEKTALAGLSLDQENGSPRDASVSLKRTANGQNHSAPSDREAALLKDYNPSLRIPPLWNCTSSTSSSSLPLTKLVFVHVFKTAGSSMRQFLTAYGHSCHRSVAIVVRCSGLSSKYLNETVWRDSDRHSCGLSYGYDATSGREYVDGKAGREEFHRVDIVGGHLPLGVHRSLPPQQQPQKVQYLTFVRDPLHKYVSGRLYSSRNDRNYTADVAVERIHNEISHRYAHGDHYDKYSSYLLAPWQRDDKPSSEQRLERMQANLVDMNVLVGVVERMPESFELLQYLLDDARELNRAFRVLQSNHVLVRNKSPLSTSDLIRRLKERDDDFERQARVVLQHEYRLYDFALTLHQRQYESLVRRRQGEA